MRRNAPLQIDPPNPSGLCQCGCGRTTPVATRSCAQKQQLRGHHIRFIKGHNRSQSLPATAPPIPTERGYVLVAAHGHPRAKSNRFYEHVLIVERSLGKYLPPGAEVHHVNEIKDDNRPTNLVVCEDRAYHRLLHQRQRALDACGHAGWLKCSYCGEYDAPENMRVPDGRSSPRHLACQSAYARRRYHAAR